MADRGPVITKLEAAHRQLATAVRLFFNDGDPVSVHTLACCAREIYEKHLAREGRERMFDLIKSANPEYGNEKALWNVLNDSRNFFKHPGDKLDDELEFSDDQNDLALLIASKDCTDLCGDKRPPEAKAFLLWIAVTHPEFGLHSEIPENEVYLREIDASFPGLRNAPRAERKRFGRSLFSDGCPVIRRR